jgi:hypothetical protein
MAEPHLREAEVSFTIDYTRQYFYKKGDDAR